MLKGNLFLRTKLLPPRAAAELLERPRLTSRLEANLDSPLTMIAADAGFGKTTLIADFIRRQPRPFVWYQLDHTDADPSVFLGYVAEGIRSFAPGFGDALLQYLAGAGEDLARFPERAGDLLINEMLGAVERPFILVLDDYHHIGRETPVHKLVDRILQYSSDLLHVVITTRDLPPLAFARRRARSEAIVITRDDLLFTDDEVRELFRRTLGVELGDGEIGEYRTRTHGWITALQLVRQVAGQELRSRVEAPRLDLSEMLRRSEKDIFDYFAEEVFSREEPETRGLLMRLALLETLPLDLCSRLFPEMRCSAELPALARKNVFLTVAGDAGPVEEYRFHPLFRDFLLRRLRSEIGHAGVADERRRIAAYFLAGGAWETALPYLIAAEDFAAAAEIVAARGQEWIASGAFTSVALFAGRIPPSHLERHPRALLHLAEVARLQGESARSSELLRKAVRLLDELNDAAGEAEALHSLAGLARRRGATREAMELLARAEALVAAGESSTFLKCANTRGLCLIMEGRLNEAEQQFRIALELAEKQENEHYVRLVTHNLALAPGLRGDFAEALRWLRRIFGDGGDDRPRLPQEAIGHLNIGRLHLYRGEFGESERNLDAALELCQLYNLKPLRGEIFEACGNLYRERGELARAAEYYERAANAYAEADIDPDDRELNEERAAFALLRGDPREARRLLEKLIAAREARGNETGVRTALVQLARVELAEGRSAGLGPGAEEALAFFHARNNYYYEALAAMTLARIRRAEGDHDGMIAAVRRVIDLSARFDYDYWLRREIGENPAIFGDEEIAERLPQDLRLEIARAANATSAAPAQEPAPAVAAPAAPITDLTVNVLGQAEIFRDPSRPFAPDAWTTRRARDIFCYIATSRRRRVAKEALIEVFWPGEDPATIEKNFHPTISHIRKALNSRQPFKQNFIVFRDGMYQLSAELSFAIDAEKFESAIAAAEEAKRAGDQARLRASLDEAYRLYRGDFMEGVADDWAEERRRHYSDQLTRVLGALARGEFAEKHWAQASRYASELLARDPYREDIHRLLLRVYAAQSKPAAVRRHFETLSALLRDDLGIEPAAETRKLYRELAG